MHARSLPLPAAALAAFLGACATTPTTTPAPSAPSAPPPEPGLYGIAAGRLVVVGGDRDVAAAAELADLGAMTYDPASRRFYAVANASTRPRLVAVDPATGEATSIGPIAADGLRLTLVEGLAVHPSSGVLYAAGGQSTFASNVLLTVDPATGEARKVARIRGTIQGEIDAMAFVDGALYAVDGAGNSSALYRLDPDLARATRLSAPFAGTVTDLAFDPRRRRLLGLGDGGRLLEVSLDGLGVRELPATVEGLDVLAVVPGSGDALFADGFESGDDSAWSGSEQRQ